MSSQFRRYVANINRIHMAELISHHTAESRKAGFKASLVVNPWTGQHYGERTESATAHGEN